MWALCREQGSSRGFWGDATFVPPSRFLPPRRPSPVFPSFFSQVTPLWSCPLRCHRTPFAALWMLKVAHPVSGCPVPVGGAVHSAVGSSHSVLHEPTPSNGCRLFASRHRAKSSCFDRVLLLGAFGWFRWWSLRAQQQRVLGSPQLCTRVPNRGSCWVHGGPAVPGAVSCRKVRLYCLACLRSGSFLLLVSPSFASIY